jgi:hypothetical protein
MGDSAMDTMRPPLERQVAPAPWLVNQSTVDAPASIQQALAHQPDASIDDIVRLLNDWKVQISGIVVAMWVLKFREQKEAARFESERLPTSSAVASPAGISYCNCDPLPCTCCKPTPDWWHQYCCDVPLTEAQMKARDRYLKPPQRQKVSA